MTAQTQPTLPEITLTRFDWSPDQERPKWLDPGFYDIDGDVFARMPGISNTALGRIMQSPRHQEARWTNPEWYIVDESRFAFGRAFHTWLLEPEIFDQEVWVKPKGFNGRTKAGKAELEAAEARVGRGGIITWQEHQYIQEMVKVIRSKKTADAMLTGGFNEVGIFWFDEDVGVNCKGKLDYLKVIDEDTVAVVDIKTTVDGSLEPFHRSIGNYGYHHQTAYYTDGVQKLLPDKDVWFLNLAIEKEPPFECALYELDAESIAIGREEYKRALATYKECRATKHWPGYPDEVQEISLPVWKKRRKS